jgi:hypothetical protein
LSAAYTAPAPIINDEISALNDNSTAKKTDKVRPDKQPIDGNSLPITESPNRFPELPPDDFFKVF